MKYFALMLLAISASGAPDCQISYRFSNRSGDSNLSGQQTIIRPPGASPQYDNRTTGCAAWNFSYDSEGFSALSIQLEDAPAANGVAGTFVAYEGTTVTGNNPSTATTSAYFTGTGYYPYLRVNLTSATGTGSINVTLNGWKSPNYIATLGGGGGSGSVTNVATTSPISGGPITTTGTIACATCVTTGGSYSDPSWITALASSKVTGLPTFPTGTIVGTTDTQTLTNKTLDGVSPTTMGFLDATSSIQTQLNGKGTVSSIATTAPLGGGTITGTGTLTCTTCGVTTNRIDQNNASTTSAQFAGVINDPTGTGAVVLGTSPTLTTPKIAQINDTNGNAEIINTATTSAINQITITNAATGNGPTIAATGTDASVSLQINPKGTSGVVSFVGSGSNLDTSSINPHFGTNNCMICVSSSRGLTSGSSGTLTFIASGDLGNISSNGFTLGPAEGLSIRSSAPGTNTTGDISIDRDAAGILGVYNGTTPGTTAANYRALKASAVYSGGTTFTATGLSVGTLIGGATAGKFTLGANGPGTVVVTMGNSATAPNGWSCFASDRTTLTALVDQSADTTTTATINFPATALSGDVVSFGCIGY